MFRMIPLYIFNHRTRKEVNLYHEYKHPSHLIDDQRTNILPMYKMHTVMQHPMRMIEKGSEAKSQRENLNIMNN